MESAGDETRPGAPSEESKESEAPRAEGQPGETPRGAVEQPGKRGFVVPALAFVVAGLMLFPLLGKSGIWDPYELDSADLARRIAVNVFGAHELTLPDAVNSLPTLTDLRMGELSFTSMALGFKVLGLHDWAGRLPLALWAFAGAASLYGVLGRLLDRRAGLYAVLVLCTMPLYVMQARTMLGDIVPMSAMAMAWAGLTGALLDRGAARAGWIVLGLAGLLSGYLSRGLILGVAAPGLGVGCSWALLRVNGGGTGTLGVRQLGGLRAGDLVGAAVLVVGAAAVARGVWVLSKATFDAPLVRDLGVALLRKPPVESTFDLTFRQLGHALFPWSAFLPFAFGRLFRAPPLAGEPRVDGGVGEGSVGPAASSAGEVAGAEEARASREREVALRVSVLVTAAFAYGAVALLAPYAGALPFSGPAVLAAGAAIAILDLERGAPPSRALSLGSALLALVLFADFIRQPEKGLAVFSVDKAAFPRSFEEGAAQGLLIAVAAFVAMAGLTWFEVQPSRTPSSFEAWARGMIRTYQEGVEAFARIWGGNLLFLLVVIEAALVGLGGMIFVGRRAGWAAVTRMSKQFSDVGVNAWWALPLAFALAPVVLLTVRDGFRLLVARSRLPRAAFMLVAGLLAGGVLGFGYYPALAAQLSPKEVFESYLRQHKEGEPLAVLGVRGRAATYYQGGEVQTLPDVARAFMWLTAVQGAPIPPPPSSRRWLVVRADDLPKLNSLYRKEAGKNVPVLDGHSSQILLVSNLLGDQPNENWIGEMVLDAEPAAITHPVRARFEDQLELIGWEVTDDEGRVVDGVVPQRPHHLRTYFRVLKPVGGTWKMFVHIDGAQRRYNGDHPVLGGRYPMNLWQVGDIVVDDHEVVLEPNFTTGEYTLYLGFFSGDNRFRVTEGPNHENRVIAGSVRVR
ncbi:glycosyltransferase family 39 protein [Chondromyces apiculatus]|uniref:Glycosyltransferase RgtA/B/C/D-like domain-containing protein n=1 Tax=Chondromyces apiculatus DSM 436 TaxID=1192034 RepID=A0A017TJB4_9BACT|nr:glycosyltransferase family 39 protein [Chondromyces apiculatus]EYF08930.1 Hypothetical protein CAP_0014 [Chondromyces apiculatus DSM 436]